MSVFRTLSLLVLLTITVAGIGVFVVWSGRPERFPLQVIEVQSNLKALEEADVKAVVVPFLVKGFFWLEVTSVQAALKQLPWVQTVEVRRVWPDKLVISIQEQTAQARWGEKGILSTEGAIFYPKPATISEKLPLFEGPDYKTKEMLQQYLTFLEILGPIGLTMRSLHLSANGSWYMTLDNDVTVVLGKTALNERLTRFALAYQSSLQMQYERVAYVDLRYTNGFAIGWKEAGLQR